MDASREFNKRSTPPRFYALRNAGRAGHPGHRDRPGPAGAARALGDSRLRSAAKLVRVELAKARLKAMQSGIAQQFRYQLGKNRFQIVPAVAVEQAELASHGTADQPR